MTQYQGRRSTDPDYGLGEHTMNCDNLGMIDESELVERLLATFKSPNYHPPRLPAVAMELMQLSQNPNIEFSEFEELLEQDATLAGEVLAVANSARFRGVRQIESLHGALVRLGMRTLRNVVVEHAMSMRVFRSSAYKGSMERLREHCRATAHMGRIVSRYTVIPEEQAFLTGLLHDVGFAGILLILGDTQRGQDPPDLGILWPAIHRAHGQAGQRMVELWGLPMHIALGVGAHHQLLVGGEIPPLAAVICLAEALTQDLGMAFRPDESTNTLGAGLESITVSNLEHIDRTDELTLHRAREALGLSEPMFKLIRDDAQQWLADEESQERKAGA